MKSKVDESTARLLVGLFVAQSDCAAKSAVIGGPDMAAAFASAFDRKETVEYENEYANFRRKNVYRELSKVDEIVNKAIAEGVVEGAPVVRRLIKTEVESKS